MKGGAQLGRKELGLLPGGEVPAPVDLVEITEARVRALRPRLRSPVDILWEDRDGYGQLDLGGPLRDRGDDAASGTVLPIESSRS